MKKFLLAALVAVASLSANAQVWLGGSLGFDVVNDKGDNNNTTNFTIAPVIGYSLSDKWDIAMEIGYQFQSNQSDAAKNRDEFWVAPFARYTFAKAGIASFYVDGGFAFGSAVMNVAENGEYIDSYRRDNTTFQIGLRPGVKLALSKKVDLDAKLGWLGYRNESDYSSRFGLNVNNEALSFGMTWKF